MDVFQLIGLLMDLWLQNTAELKETKLKREEEENVIHHIWTGNTCIMYTAVLALCVFVSMMC